ncbi:hypothetical protein HYN56_04005 [Flavobacterium crocinum]|uniref:Ig-like domain-containing protein n=2 Tax=Flavobacterium crocinum TaxID=2183896 RepID=A0A2S1YHH0_9FLAO|nr:hypothetical protein HYN56_04005 [Flavobacterium crocinum]
MRKLLYSFLFFIFLHTTGFSQRVWSGATSSDWNTASNWSSGGVPGPGVAVEIPSVAVYPVVSSTVTCSSITFSGNVGALTVNSGAVLNTGAITINSSNSSPRNVTIIGGGTLSASSVTIGLTSTQSSTNRETTLTSTIANFNISGNLTLNSSRYRSSIFSSYYYNNARFYLENGILDLNGQIVIENENSNNSPVLSMATGAESGLLLLGNSTPFSLTSGNNDINLNGNNATVNYDLANPQTVYITPYNNLTLSGSGAKTFAGTVSIANNLSINAGATATFNATGNGAKTLTLNGNGQNSGTWGGTGTGAGNIQTTYFNAPAATPANKFVTITNTSCTAGYWTGVISTDWNVASNWCGNVLPTNTTDVVIPSGTPNQPTITSVTGSVRNLTVNSGATLTLANTGTTFLNVSGDFINNGTLTGNASSTVTLTGGVSVLQGSGATAFGNLTINKGSASNTVTNSAKAFSVSGNLTVTNGNLILSATDANYTVSNNLSIASGSTLTHKVNWSNNVLLSVGGNIAIDGAYSTGGESRTHVQMTGSGKTVHTGMSALNILTLLTGGNITIDGDLTVNDNFWAFYNATGGTFNIPSPYTVTAKQSLLNAGGTITINGGNLKVNGGLGVGYSLTNGSVTLNSGTLDADFVNIGDGTRTGTFSHTGGMANIGNLTINSGSNSYTCTNSPALNISGTWANSGTFARATSTVTFNGADQTVPNFSYYNLAFSGSGTKTLTATTTINNNLSIASGVMSNLGTGLIHSATTLTLGGSAASSGSWGSTTSAATNQTNTFFSATTGIINVASTTCTVPTQQTFTGGGTTCNSTTGVAIGLAGSQNGFSYQLYRGSTALNTVTGTGGAISFGNFNVSGTYYVTATSTTFCSVRFTSTVSVTSYTTPAIPTSTITNVSCPSDATGAIAITGTPAPAALEFVSTSNQVVDLGSTLLSGRGTFTVEGWIKFDKTLYASRMALFGQNDVIEIAFEGNSIRCWTPNGGYVDFPLSSYPSDYNWHHIAVTGDGTANGLKIYLDGGTPVTGGSATSSYGTSSSTAKIGYAVMDDTGNGFTGQFFKVGFWSKALSAAEVSALAGGFVDYNASQSGLLAGFNFGEGTGNTIASVGSNAVTGALGPPSARPVWRDPSSYSWTSTPAGFTSSSKNLTGLTPRTYNLNISLKNCSRSTSFTVNATNTAPSITTQPSSSAICVGSNTSFSVVGAGTGVSYRWQWRANSSGTFANVPNSGVYSNVATATMNITGATTGMNGYQYRVVVSGTCTPTVNSDVVTLTVNPNLAASVSISAPSTTICAGTSVTFTANPTNQGTAPTYQWKLNGSDVGTNSTTYTTTGLTNGSTVTCVLTSNASPCLTGSPTTSNTITMTVNPNQPASVSIAASTSTTICAGTSVTFTATPTNQGTAPTYQWKINGGNVGTNSTTYTTTGLVNNDQVTCVMISNATPCLTGSPATSNTVTITVNQIQTTPTVGTKTDVTCLNQGTIPLSGLPSGSWQINQTGPGSATSSFGGAGSTTTVTGLAAGTYKFTVQTATTCVSAETAPVTITDESSTEWDGSNWSHGLPDNTKSVVINSTAGNPFPNDIEGCSLTINVASGFVTVPTGRTLTITNAVNGNGKLLFKTGSSLIQKNASIANTTEIVYERETYVRRYDGTYWSMPVTKDHFKMVDFSPNTLADKYLLFSPSAGWVVNYGGTEEMKSGKGYGIRAPQSNDINTPQLFTGVFTGTPNNGNIPVTVESGLWNLVGNPYPSAISARTFLDDNPGVGAIYLWAHQSLPVSNGSGDGKYYYLDDFTIFNSLGAAGNPYRPFLGYVAATQGFLIKAPAATTTINFNNLQRLAGNNSQFYKTDESAIERNRVWINLTNTTGTFKQILLGYATGATNAIDVNFDALSMASTNAVDFYSINSSKKMIIQGRALPFLKTDTVPLGIILTAKGEYTIAIDHADGFFNDGQDIFLQDKTTGKTTNLRLANYTFTSEVGSFNSRFVLRYTDNTLGTDDFDSLENSVLVSVKNKTVKISSSKESIKEVNVFNIGAQLMYTKNNVNSSELEISNLHSSDQALLVKITLENGHSFTKKIIYSNL